MGEEICEKLDVSPETLRLLEASEDDGYNGEDFIFEGMPKGKKDDEEEDEEAESGSEEE